MKPKLVVTIGPYSVGTKMFDHPSAELTASVVDASAAPKRAKDAAALAAPAATRASTAPSPAPTVVERPTAPPEGNDAA